MPSASFLTDRSPLAVSVFAGVVYAVALLGFAFLVQKYEFTGEGITAVLVPLWTVGGLIVSTAVPTYLLVRYGLVAPAGVWLLNLILLVRAELSPTPGEPLNVQFIAWFVPLAVGLVLGGIEYLGRSRVWHSVTG